MTSTYYDSVVTFDLEKNQYTEGICLRNDIDRVAKKALWKVFGMKRPPGVKIARFDPNSLGGPRMDDVLHLNSVFVSDGVPYLSTYRTNFLFAIRGNRLETVSP